MLEWVTSTTLEVFYKSQDTFFFLSHQKTLSNQSYNLSKLKTVVLLIVVLKNIIYSRLILEYAN